MKKLLLFALLWPVWIQAQPAITIRAPRNVHTVRTTNLVVLGTNAYLPSADWKSGWGTNLCTAALPGVVFSVTAVNYSASDLWLMAVDWHSLTNAGTNGATPCVPAVPIYGGSYGGFDWGSAGRVFTNGIIFAASSTPHTLTNIGAQALQTTNFTLDINYERSY